MTFRDLLTPVALLLTAGAAASQSVVREHLGAPGEPLWREVAGVGDVNADGTPDYAMTVWPSRVRVHDGATGALLYTIEDTTHEHFGYSIAGAGDVNRDGHADLIVGAPISDVSAYWGGAALVYSGVDGSLLHLVPGPPVHDARSGWSVSTAGDVNGDSHADFVVGAPGMGAARVFSGLDGSLLRSVAAGTEDSGFGFSVDGGHDVDGDGTPDFLVGAPYDRTTEGIGVGSVRAFSGADGSLLFTIFGRPVEDFHMHFGYDAALLPDLDGDGRADLVVGAPQAGYEAGRADVFSGATQALLYTLPGEDYAELGSSVSSAGDVDGDGVADVLVGSPEAGTSGRVHLLSGSDGTVLIELSGDLALSGSNFADFGASVSGVGDVTGDSRSEVLVCAPYFYSPATGQNGKVVLLDLFNDCNANGEHDTLDVLGGGSPDCNTNGVPDECDITAGTSPDCNANGVPDECDVVARTSADCDVNGIPDECQVAAGTSTDCDGDGVLDACYLPGVPFHDVSPDLGPLEPSTPLAYSLPGTARLATGDVTLTFTARGDLDGPGEWVTVALNGTELGDVFTVGYTMCVEGTDSLVVPHSVFNHLVAGGSADFTLTPRYSVEGCFPSRIRMAADYETYSDADCNGNGLPDACDLAAGTSLDQDADGVPDECEFEVFCDAAVNSTGAPAAISWSGTNSVSANDLVLLAASLPTFASGLLIYSPDQASVPLGNGVLCLGSTTQGFINRLPPEQSDAGGVLTHLLDLTSPPVPASAITPGSTWNFSCWFRDVPAGGAGFNFSDGLRVTFQP